MSQTDPVQAQLIAARKNQILDAAAKVFAEKGFSRATIKDVARTAGIADGTIYNYFENKEALLLGILERLNEIEQRDIDMARLNDMGAETFMPIYIRQRMDELGPHMTAVFKVLMSEMLINKELADAFNRTQMQPTYAIAEKYFRVLAERGEIKSDDVALVVRLMAATFFGVEILLMLGDEVLERNLEGMPQLLTDFVLKGIQNE